jgi:signal transduction histidine kinase/CheY-like chemotaxis protein
MEAPSKLPRARTLPRGGPRLGWLRVALVGAAILLAAVGVGGVATVLYFRLADEAASPQENVQWAISQVQIEHLKMMNTLVLNETGQASEDELLHRYELFVSRLTIIRDGDGFSELRGYDPIYTAGQIALGRIAATDSALAQRAAGTPAAPIIRNHIADLGPALHKATLDSLHFALRRQNERQRWLLSLITWLGLTVLALVAGTVLFAGATLLHMRRLDRSRAELALLTDSLSEARDAAEAGSRAKSTFLASMSHEMRTPLNGIIGIVQELRLTTADAAQSKLLETAHRVALGMRTLVNDVLDMSRIETGHIDFKYEPMRPIALVSEIAAALRSRATERGITILTDVGPGAENWIAADRARLRQVLLNLAGNAIKFTTGQVVEISLSMIDEGGGPMARFAVRDEGPGIPAEDQARIFERFTTRDVHQGSGLGLAISRELIQRMDGRIGVDSTVGRGSVFWFAVPAPPADAPERRRPTGLPSLKGLKLLVVEDNDVNQLVVKMILTRHGAEFRMADSGEAGLDVLSEWTPDLVLMDIHMPGMGGLAATAAIRRLPDARANLPIVALTADAIEEHLRTFRAAGMSACVTKPIDEPEMVRTIAQICGRMPASAPATAPVATQAPSLDPAPGPPEATEEPPLPDDDRRALLDLAAKIDRHSA